MLAWQTALKVVACQCASLQGGFDTFQCVGQVFAMLHSCIGRLSTSIQALSVLMMEQHDHLQYLLVPFAISTSSMLYRIHTCRSVMYMPTCSVVMQTLCSASIFNGLPLDVQWRHEV